MSNGVKRGNIKREIDLQMLGERIGPGNRVLDLGCGRGLLLEHLRQTKGIYGVGVDNDPSKVESCVRRGVTVYQGDIESVLGQFPEDYFDWVVCSRTLQELERPTGVLLEALRVGRRVAVGFINSGYWKNRISMLLHGRRVRNEVHPEPWYESRRTNPVSVGDFEEFCRDHQVQVHQRLFLRGDWRTPLNYAPLLLAGYAIYELSRRSSTQSPSLADGHR
jgi:methionine biosynthesis protein MetW